MKWILAILILINATAFGQIGQGDDSTKYIRYQNQYGTRMPRSWWDSVAHMPYGDTAIFPKPSRPGAIMMHTDKFFYKWNGSRWAVTEKATQLTDSSFKVGADTIVIRGTLPSWQQTLNVSHNTSGRLIFDTSYTKPTGVDDPATHTWFTMKPLVKADDTVTSPFYWNQFAGLNNGEVNEVMMFGWNLSPGGGAAQVGKPALGESWESNYKIIEVPDFNRLMEKHEYYISPAGLQYRLGSYTINTNAGTCNYYHSVDNFNLRTFQPAGTNTPYFSVQGGTEMTLINPNNEFDYFKFGCNYAQDVNTSSLTISNSTVKPISLFNLSNFTGAALPNSSFAGKGYDGAELSFVGRTTGSLSRLLSDSSQLRLEAFTNAPTNFVTDGIQTMSLFKTKMKVATPLAVNDGSFSSTPFAAFQSTANSSSLEAAGWFQQSGTNGTKYGIEVYASGASSVNEAIYVSAQNASNNRGIRIQYPSAGASNYAIYSDATAQSFFNGKIGIGTSTPDSLLHVNGGIHVTGGAKMEANLGVNGYINGITQLRSTGTGAAISAGSGAGSLSTLSITGGDAAGKIDLTVGSSPSSSATIGTITFNTAYASVPVVVLTPGNAAAAALTGNAQVYVSSINTTNFVVTVGSTALTTSTQYIWYYHVIQ